MSLLPWALWRRLTHGWGPSSQGCRQELNASHCPCDPPKVISKNPPSTNMRLSCSRSGGLCSSRLEETDSRLQVSGLYLGSIPLLAGDAASWPAWSLGYSASSSISRCVRCVFCSCDGPLCPPSLRPKGVGFGGRGAFPLSLSFRDGSLGSIWFCFLTS